MRKSQESGWKSEGIEYSEWLKKAYQKIQDTAGAFFLLENMALNIRLIKSQREKEKLSLAGALIKITNRQF